MFLRRLLDTAHSAQELESTVPISREAAKDIEWWLHFAKAWNGIALFLEPHWTPSPQFELFTDTSGTLGFGAYWNGAWFSGTWSAELASKPIEWKELYAIMMASCRAWGHNCSSKKLLFCCDNSAVVSIWESGLSRSSDLMCLVRALFHIAAKNNFHVLIRHIPGIDNSIADALSHLQLQRFLALAPHVAMLPTPIPASPTLD